MYVSEFEPNQSIQKEISPEYSLEGLMLKLKLQYFGYLMQRTDSSEKTVLLGKIEGERRIIDVFELWWWGKTLENPLDCKEIKPVNPKGDQS